MENTRKPRRQHHLEDDLSTFVDHTKQVILVALSISRSRIYLLHLPINFVRRLPSAAMAVDNANPTILSASELPSHRQRRLLKEAESKKHGIRELLTSRPSYASDPFYLSDFSDADSEDSTAEPIDEQEIYGEQSTCILNVDRDVSFVKSHATALLKNYHVLPAQQSHHSI